MNLGNVLSGYKVKFAIEGKCGMYYICEIILKDRAKVYCVDDANFAHSLKNFMDMDEREMVLVSSRGGYEDTIEKYFVVKKDNLKEINVYSFSSRGLDYYVKKIIVQLRNICRLV